MASNSPHTNETTHYGMKISETSINYVAIFPSQLTQIIIIVCRYLRTQEDRTCFDLKLIPFPRKTNTTDFGANVLPLLGSPLAFEKLEKQKYIIFYPLTHPIWVHRCLYGFSKVLLKP